MKDQDLAIKAADVFLVWPEWVEVILFNTLTNEFYMSAITENEFNMNCAKGLTDRKVWQIIINREQHIRKRIEMFDGATIDAEFYSAKEGCFVDVYFKEKGGEWFFVLPRYSEWTRLNPQNTIEQRILIPRPTPEELAYIAELDGDKKWAPEVGEECEANLIGEPTFLCMPNAIVKDKIWFTEVREGKKDRDFVYKLNELDFRPLKTQSEKDTEAAYELVKDAVDLYQACEILVEAGYKK